MLSGAVAGAVVAAMLGATTRNAAGAHRSAVIAAIVLGGASLQGERGPIRGTLVAVLILGMRDDGPTLIRVKGFWQDVMRGVVLTLAVGLDGPRQRLGQGGG